MNSNMTMKKALLLSHACALLMVGVLGTSAIAEEKNSPAPEATALTPILMQEDNGVVVMDETPSHASAVSMADKDFLFELNALLEGQATHSKAMMNQGKYVEFISVLPAEGDLSLEDAVNAAKKAIADKYAVKEEVFDLFAVYADLRVTDADDPTRDMLTFPVNEKRTWFISFNPEKTEDYSDIGEYVLEIDAKTGEIEKFLSAAESLG